MLLEEANLRNMIKSEGLLLKFKKAFSEQFSCEKTKQKPSIEGNTFQQNPCEQKSLDEDLIKQNSKIYGRTTQRELTY